LAGLLIIVWSVWFVQRKYGSGVFSAFALSISGGWMLCPEFSGLMTTIVAKHINFLCKDRSVMLLAFLRRFLTGLWMALLIVFAVMLLSSMFAAIFGFIPLTSNLFQKSGMAITRLFYALGYSMLMLLPLTIL
jgi:hypothetical protein